MIMTLQSCSFYSCVPPILRVKQALSWYYSFAYFSLHCFLVSSLVIFYPSTREHQRGPIERLRERDRDDDVTGLRKKRCPSTMEEAMQNLRVRPHAVGGKSRWLGRCWWAICCKEHDAVKGEDDDSGCNSAPTVVLTKSTTIIPFL